MQNFTFNKMEIEGPLLITPFFVKDERGYFLKDYSDKVFQENGLNYELKEVFYAKNQKNVVRGLHFQREKIQEKLVSCVVGRIYDVVVDIRKNSESFGKWTGAYLTDENHHAIYVPAGFAHGYFTLEPSIVSYKCNEVFYGEYDDGIFWNDPDLNIVWPTDSEPILSDKDRKLQTFKDFTTLYQGL